METGGSAGVIMLPPGILWQEDPIGGWQSQVENQKGESQKEKGAAKGGSAPKIHAGDKTPKGREYTKHGAERANERGFNSSQIDSIIENNYRHRTKEIDNVTGKVTCRLSENSGKTWRQGSGYGIIKPSEAQRRTQAWGIFKERIGTR